MFRNPQESHEHSLQTLDELFRHDDFMLSIKTVIDLGCGSGRDLEWWATRTTRDEEPVPLNIKCTGVDLIERPTITKQYTNIKYQQSNFEGIIQTPPDKFDVLWCHDSFQYCLNPIQTLSKWHEIASDGAMLVIVIKQTTNIHRHDLDFAQEDGAYYHYTLINLIHMLAVAGWDCKAGFFKKDPTDPWIHAVVYKSSHSPMDPATTRWYDLVEKELLPATADKCINAKGYLEQKSLTLPWLDKSLMWLGQH
jgi:SAM-dependent methyltransferase